MPWLTDLAVAVRTSGLPVTEHPGWQTRGHGPMSSARGVMCHHTVGARTGDYPSLVVVRDGRPGLPGPLSQLGLGRTGRVHVIAAGRSYHAGYGAWPGLTGNGDILGIEAESVGDGSDWTPEQRWAYPVLCRALSRWYRIPPDRVIAHREWAPRRKVDPRGIDMTTLRRIVAGAPAGPAPAGLGGLGEDTMTPAQMAELKAHVDARIREAVAAVDRVPERVVWGTWEARKVPRRADGTEAPAGYSLGRWTEKSTADTAAILARLAPDVQAAALREALAEIGVTDIDEDALAAALLRRIVAPGA